MKMDDGADARSCLPFQMLDGVGGRAEEGRRRHSGSHRRLGTGADLRFRSWIQTGVERVMGPGAGLPGESQ